MNECVKVYFVYISAININTASNSRFWLVLCFRLACRDFRVRLSCRCINVNTVDGKYQWTIFFAKYINLQTIPLQFSFVSLKSLIEDP